MKVRKIQKKKKKSNLFPWDSLAFSELIKVKTLQDLVRNIFIVHEDEEEKHVTDTKKDKSFLQEYKVVLDSSTTEESLVGFLSNKNKIFNLSLPLNF